MWDLEYLLLFGVTNNKTEVYGGGTRVSFPSRDRAASEEHLRVWTETWARIRDTEAPAPTVRGNALIARVAGTRFAVFGLPLHALIPVHGELYYYASMCSFDEELWGATPGAGPWSEAPAGHSETCMGLYRLGSLATSGGQGWSATRLEVLLTDTDVCGGDFHYFSSMRVDPRCDDYVAGIPDLVAEVLSPNTWAHDRGDRKQLFARVGVPHFWILDPKRLTLECYELAEGEYRLMNAFREGDTFVPRPMLEAPVSVNSVFDIWGHRHPSNGASQTEPLPEWFAPPEEHVGIESLLLLGHPDRRREIIANRTPAVLPFGCEAEAVLRFEGFLKDLCRWEGAGHPTHRTPTEMGEEAEIGRFRLRRQGRVVRCDVRVDGRKYREMALLWSDNDAWNWDEDDWEN